MSGESDEPDQEEAGNHARRSTEGVSPTFLSRDFLELAGRLGKRSKASSVPNRSSSENHACSGEGQSFDFDLLIIGSGYGASMALRTLAGRTLEDPATGKSRFARIGLLERGAERLPGSFPERLADLPGELRFQSGSENGLRGVRTGLFDIRLGNDLSALVGNGLGGGSLINAGVMIEPSSRVFEKGVWPRELSGMPACLQNAYREARLLLGSAHLPEAAKPVNAAGSPARARPAASLDVMSGDRPVPVVDNTIEIADSQPAKFRALQTLSLWPDRVSPVPITVQLDAVTDRHAIRVAPCIQCGDCATGCNHNAKLSLDVVVLAEARMKEGVEIFTGATVLRFERIESGGWIVHVVPTNDALRARLGGPFQIRCAKLILAAGAYGSTEIMLRSGQADAGLTFSPRLGHGFTGNGDMIAAISDLPFMTNGVGGFEQAPASRQVGPTITGMIDLRDCPHGAVIQEIGIPHPLKQLLCESLGLLRVLAAVEEGWGADLADSDPLCTVDEEALLRCLIFAVIGDDKGRGKLTLTGQSLSENVPGEVGSAPLAGDGAVSMTWEVKPDPGFQQAQIDRLKRMAGHAGGLARAHSLGGGRQGWGSDIARELGAGTVLTVHPLGGCPMGRDWATGVTDHIGRVRRSGDAGAALYDDLVVLDGSVMPMALGINPALTIAALSLRASRLLAGVWGWAEAAVSGPGSVAGGAIRRPAARIPPPVTEPLAQRPTTLELIERLDGPATLRSELGEVEVRLELTLRSLPFDPRALIQMREASIPLRSTAAVEPSSERLPPMSFIRVYRKEAWDQIFDARGALAHRSKLLRGSPEPQQANAIRTWLEQYQEIDAPEEFLDRLCYFKAPVSGYISLLREEPLSARRRRILGWWAWLRNIGFRWGRQKIRNLPFGGAFRIRSGELPVSSHADAPASQSESTPWWEAVCRLDRHIRNLARRRVMRYEMEIHDPGVDGRGDGPTAADLAALRGLLSRQSKLQAEKRLQYRTAANPWRQLMELSVTEGPGLVGAGPVTLSLDTRYLAWTRTPLLSIVSEDNHVDGLVDLASFVAHAGRRILLNHSASFSRPDDSPAPTAKQDPSIAAVSTAGMSVDLDDLGGGNQHRLAQVLDRAQLTVTRFVCTVNSELPLPADVPSQCLLTRYCDSSGTKREANPVLMIHGYSASGTTFAHSALPESLASDLARDGREAWVLDMRSSSGMRSATHPWRFEDLAFGDIPTAIDKILTETGATKVDVIAHCMGAVMLSIAVLAPVSPLVLRGHSAGLEKKIGRVVLSQAGPVMRFQGLNIFRAYAMNTLRWLLQEEEIRLVATPGQWSDSLLDRLLSTLPYPDPGEFWKESPFWWSTPWTGTRHRMDAIFGQVFSTKNISRAVLARIDDFFGPMSVATISQSLFFALNDTLATTYGESWLPSLEDFRETWTMKTLSIHAEQNGVLDPYTLVLMRQLFDQCQISDRLETELFPDIGHQDGLIGRAWATRPVSNRIREFLNG